MHYMKFLIEGGNVKELTVAQSAEGRKGFAGGR